MTIKFQNLYCLVVIFLFATTGFAQAQASGDAKWVRIKDDNLDFSVLFPPNYLVDNEIEKSFVLAPVLASLPEVIDLFEKPKIISNQKSVRMSLSVFQLRQTPTAKNYLWYFVERDAPKENYDDFRVGDFVGRKTTYDTEKTLAMRVAVAVKNKVFVIDASAKNEDEKIYEKFVMSLMLNGKPLFKSQTSEPTDSPSSVLISTLQTSPEILEALNQKQEKSEIKVIKNAVGAQGDKEEQNFSRPLVLLRQPYLDFTGAAKSGIVKLKVTFLATGKIGNIIVVSDSSSGLTDSAVKAARKIKFLPAEADGGKIDATKTIEYGLNVR